MTVETLNSRISHILDRFKWSISIVLAAGLLMGGLLMGCAEHINRREDAHLEAVNGKAKEYWMAWDREFVRK